MHMCIHHVFNLKWYESAICFNWLTSDTKTGACFFFLTMYHKSRFHSPRFSFGTRTLFFYFHGEELVQLFPRTFDDFLNII